MVYDELKKKKPEIRQELVVWLRVQYGIIARVTSNGKATNRTIYDCTIILSMIARGKAECY